MCEKLFAIANSLQKFPSSDYDSLSQQMQDLFWINKKVELL